MTEEEIKIRQRLILAAEDLLFSARKYNDLVDGNPFKEMIDCIEKGLELILFPKDKE